MIKQNNYFSFFLLAIFLFSLLSCAPKRNCTNQRKMINNAVIGRPNADLKINKKAKRMNSRSSKNR